MRKIPFMATLIFGLIQLSAFCVSASGLPAVTVNIPVEHIITGDEYIGDESFSFVLEAENHSDPMPDGSSDGMKKVTSTGSGKVDFGDIVFSYPDAYYYRMYRMPEEDTELERDESAYRIMIAAYSDGSSGITIWKEGEDGKTDSIVFEDKYTRPVIPEKKRIIPKTGDPNSFAGWLITMTAALGGMLSLIMKHRKIDKNRSVLKHIRSDKLPALFITATVTACLICSSAFQITFALEGESVPEETQTVQTEIADSVQESEDTSVEQQEIDAGEEDPGAQETSQDETEEIQPEGKDEEMLPESGDSVSEGNEEIENSIDYDDPVPQVVPKRLLAAAAMTGKIVSSYSDGKGRRFRMEGMEGIALCSWDSKTPAPDGSSGTYREITADTAAKQNVNKVMYYGIKKNAADTPLKKLRVHRMICYWLHGVSSLRDEAREQLPRAQSYVKQFTDKPLPPASERFQVFEWTPLGNYSDKQTIVAYRKAPYVRTPEYRSEKKPDRKFIRYGSTEKIGYTIRTEEIYTDAGAGSFCIKDDLARGLLHLDADSISIAVSGGSYSIDKSDDSGLWITFRSEAANGSKPYIKVSYKATVNWDAYTGGDIRNALTDYTPEPVRVTTDISLQKEVRGNLRDTTKKFEFTVELTGLDSEQIYSVETNGGGELFRASTGTLDGAGFKPDASGNAEVIFKLKGGQGAVIKDLPIGGTYRVTETENDHRASYMINADGNTPMIVKDHDSNDINQKILSTESETIDPGDGIATIVFTNTREIAPTSGIVGSIDWRFAGICSLSVLSAAAAFVIRRKLRCRNGY